VKLMRAPDDASNPRSAPSCPGRLRSKAPSTPVPAPRFARTVAATLAFGMLTCVRVAAEPSSTMDLPPPRTDSHTSIEEALRQRRSVRSFAETPLTAAETSQLLWAAQGVTEPQLGLRSAPSAGALYPLEIYLGTADGVVHYVPHRHAIRRHSKQDIREDLYRAALRQDPVRDAPAVFIFVAVMTRTARKYGEERAPRYAYMEVGHATQNLLLQAVALDLAGVPVGAFEDHAVREALKLPETHHPLYLVPLGRAE
jgi:SagB-type dehydrogenase family enzyme